MRFTTPEALEQRTRAGFLWLPRTIGRQTRWLESAQWMEIYFYGQWRAWAWLEVEAPAKPHDGLMEGKG